MHCHLHLRRFLGLGRLKRWFGIAMGEEVETWSESCPLKVDARFYHIGASKFEGEGEDEYEEEKDDSPLGEGCDLSTSVLEGILDQ